MIRETYDLSPEQRAAHEKEFGSYNSLPPNMVDISFMEGVGLLSRSHGYRLVEHRQPTWHDDSKNPSWGFLGDMTLIYLDEHSGFGYWRHYVPSHKIESGSTNAKDGSNEYRLEFFRFGCRHVYGPDEGKRTFEHAFTCKKCGHKYAYDSSG